MMAWSFARRRERLPARTVRSRELYLEHYLGSSVEKVIVSNSERTVAVWRTSWLPASETWIRNEIDAAGRWRSRALGMDRVDSALSASSDCIINHTRVERAALNWLGISPKISRWLRANEIDVVHAHFAYDAALIAPICRRLRVPLVVSVLGQDVTSMARAPGLRGVRYRRRLKSTFTMASAILAISEPLRAAAVKLGAPEARTKVHHIGIPLPSVAGRKGPPVYDVLMVGRLVEKKGMRYLLEAVNLLPPDLRSCHVAIIGGGPLESDLRAQASALTLNVTFLGVQGPEEVAVALTRSRIFAMPSVKAQNGDTEGLPFAVLEASAAELPILAFRHSGIPEAVKHGETGLLCEERDVPSLATNLQQLLQDTYLREQLGRAGRAFVAQEFDIDGRTKALELVLDAAVAHR